MKMNSMILTGTMSVLPGVIKVKETILTALLLTSLTVSAQEPQINEKVRPEEEIKSVPNRGTTKGAFDVQGTPVKGQVLKAEEVTPQRNIRDRHLFHGDV